MSTHKHNSVFPGMLKLNGLINVYNIKTQLLISKQQVLIYEILHIKYIYVTLLIYLYNLRLY